MSSHALSCGDPSRDFIALRLGWPEFSRQLRTTLDFWSSGFCLPCAGITIICPIFKLVQYWDQT